MSRSDEDPQVRAATATNPVRLSVTVRAPVEHAFAVFTQDIGKWWPVETHSIEPEQVSRAHMECRRGGRVVQVGRDGTETRWGEVLAWEPPTRLVLGWNPSLEARPDTEIEVTFLAVSETETVVDLEHRGWERLGDASGLRATYETGWVPVLDRYRERASTP